MRIGYDAKRIFHNTTGLGNYGRDLVRIMASFFPENEYVLYNPYQAKTQRFEPKENMRIKYPSGIYSMFPSLWRSKGIIKDLKKDRIELYHGLSGELPWGISRTGIPSVVTVHDVIFMRFPEWYKSIDRSIYKKKFLRAVNEANKIVAISKQTRDDIVEFSNINPEKVEVIYQGCHPIFKSDIPVDYQFQVQEKYALPVEFALYVGTIEPRKNAFTIVKAMKDLPYHLVLAGKETDYARQIRAYIKSHGMSDRIRFLGNLDLNELAAMYRLAKVFIYPSIYEGFGIPIIESLYSGTPVITNAKGVFPEAAGPGGIYLENVFDENEMREKIRFAMENDLTDYVRKGREFVKKFDDENIARQWMEVYKSLKKDKIESV